MTASRPPAMPPILPSVLLLAVAGALALAAAPAAAQEGEAADAAMRQLAQRSGCFACHHIDPGGQGPDGLAPIGPAWRDVSVKYAADRSMEDRLVATVLGGSTPQLSHWKGRAGAGGATMPPNQVTISRDDARALVRWILALGPRP